MRPYEDVPLDEVDDTFSARVATAGRAIADGVPRSRPESAIVAGLLEWLNSHEQCHARKVHQTAVTGGGEPDIDAVIRGRAVKIEVKRPGAPPPRAAQMHSLRCWQRAGALVGWVTCLAELVEIVGHLDDPQPWVNPLTGPGAPVAPSG